MKIVSLPDYDEFNLAVQKALLKLHPAQLHGLACGVLCGQIGEPRWEELLIPHDEKSNETSQSSIQNSITSEHLSSKSLTLLHHLYEISNTQLDEFSFEFELLLPQDSQPLTTRAEALTLWCQGFLTGLNRAKVPIRGRETGESTEAINDLIEIAKMNYEEVVDSEEDEAAYIELVEFVRVAVTLIYQDEKDKVSKANKNLQHLH